MKYCLVFMFLFISVVTVAEAGEPTHPRDIAKLLRKDLPAGWSIKSDLHSIVISRDEQVTLLHPYGLPSSTFNGKLLREFGRKADYRIVLLFRPRMTDQLYSELKTKRDKAIQKIHDDPQMVNNRMKYQPISEARKRHPLPDFFNYRFSIYMSRTDPPPYWYFLNRQQQNGRKSSAQYPHGSKNTKIVERIFRNQPAVAARTCLL